MRRHRLSCYASRTRTHSTAHTFAIPLRPRGSIVLQGSASHGLPTPYPLLLVRSLLLRLRLCPANGRDGSSCQLWTAEGGRLGCRSVCLRLRLSGSGCAARRLAPGGGRMGQHNGDEQRSTYFAFAMLRDGRSRHTMNASDLLHVRRISMGMATYCTSTLQGYLRLVR